MGEVSQVDTAMAPEVMGREQGGSQLARAEQGPITGTFHNGQHVTARLEDAMHTKAFHVVTPATAVGALPEGFGVALSVVEIDVKGDTHPIAGDARGLLKSALYKIAAASGVQWDPSQCGRTDDRKHPLFCSWKAVGFVTDFSNKRRAIIGEVEMDLRDGSPMVEGILAKSRDAAKAQEQLRDMRKWITRHTETRAYLRAVRTLGIRTSYSAQELERPFLCAQLQWTGKSKNPALQAEFAMMGARAHFAASASLYGSAPQSSEPEPLKSAPALPSSSFVDSHVVDDDDGMRRTPVPTAPQSQASAPAQTRQTPAASRPSGGGGARKGRDEIPFGRAKGVKLRDAEDRDLEWLANHLKKSIADPEKASFIDGNKADLAMVDAELKRRAGEDEEPPADDGY